MQQRAVNQTIINDETQSRPIEKKAAKLNGSKKGNKAKGKQKQAIPSSLKYALPSVSQATPKKMLAPHYSKIFQAFSKIQGRFSLKFGTLHLAFSIFEKYTLSKRCPQILAEQIFACQYIAMKYQEIYPPSLRQILPYFAIKILSIKDYRYIQLKILQAIDFDLNLPTHFKIIDECLFSAPRMTKLKRMIAFYWLQLAIVTKTIYEYYSTQQICETIVKLLGMEGKQFQDRTLMTPLIALLVEAKGTATYISATEIIKNKFQNDAYEQASLIKFPLNL